MIKNYFNYLIGMLNLNRTLRIDYINKEVKKEAAKQVGLQKMLDAEQALFDARKATKGLADSRAKIRKETKKL